MTGGCFDALGMGTRGDGVGCSKVVTSEWLEPQSQLGGGGDASIVVAGNTTLNSINSRIGESLSAHISTSKYIS